MKVNKDNVVGAIVMFLAIAVIVWGIMITSKVNKIAIAHDRLVAVLDPVIQEIQRVRQAVAQKQAQQSRQEPVPPAEDKPSKGK